MVGCIVATPSDQGEQSVRKMTAEQHVAVAGSPPAMDLTCMLGRLHIRSGDVAEVAPRRAAWLVLAFTMLFVLTGLSILLLGLFPQLGLSEESRDSEARLSICVGGVVFILLGLGSSYVVFKILRERVTFDLPAGRLHSTQRLPMWVGSDHETELSKLDGFQIGQRIERTAMGNKGGPRTMFDVNAVFAEPPGRRIRLISSSDEGAVRSDAERLSHLLKLPLVDSTSSAPAASNAEPPRLPSSAPEPETPREGLGFPVSSAPAGQASWTFRASKVEFVSPVLVRIGPTLCYWVFRIALCGIGAGAIVLGVLLWSVFGFVFMFIGLILLVVGLRAMRPFRMRLDLGSGIITSNRPSPKSLGVSKSVPVKAVAAVQLCSRYWERGGTTTFEMNLAFRVPAGRRWPLTGSEDGEAIRSDAQRLADFLNVPLLDDTESPRTTPDANLR